MDKEITIKIDTTTLKHLDEEAKANNISVNLIIQRAIKRWIVLRIIKEIEDGEDEKKSQAILF